MKTFGALFAVISGATALSIAEINGNRFISPYNGQTVTNVEGLVTAVSSAGFYLRSTKADRDAATSEGLYVYGSNAAKTVTVGDIITVSGKVSEYRSNVDYLYLTELTSPQNITIVSSGAKVKPLVIGKDTYSPPTSKFSSLDEGGLFGVPNNVSRISVANPKLQPKKYGLDFWESIVGELVTIKEAYGVGRPNQYGDVWVRGNWKVTGKNKQGGLTMTDGDANPETIIIGTPLDASKNPTDTKMGDYYGDITGVVSYAFGFYRVLPLTHITPERNSSAAHPPVSFTSKGSCKGITVADYNAENLAPTSTHLPQVVDQIINMLKTPDLLFLQEVQDNSGSKNDGVVSANVTLTTLVDSLFETSGVQYAFAEVEPENLKDGGQPGGNIRVAYLYRPDVVELYKPNQGGSNDANEVLPGPLLKYNPGRIDPANAAWVDSRKPLVAMWRAVKGGKKPFFTVNVHFTSKGGSTSLHGDARPPVNLGVDQRTMQAEVTADFIAQILEEDKKAYVIAAGDFNEFVQVQPLQTFAKKSGLTELDEVAKISMNERYTYLFDMNSEALDHMYVSKGIGKSVKYEHMNLNTWQNYDDQVSDHDPSVARFDLC
ncbi:probable endonuclease/exonuclease/phosphatase family protein [Cephalotrichum gorgonifer]|uniref:Probable endonuclease/exonuclease/phosphatase family protein n=1 Tax=Cephalotrichum gorgonifer TaxID=2041049 RepID=A0AAE8N196_9PEZI|nr:probable endonuclease/exonuclease/phosphatase family protein [Cephalotrichum gorgonifer]